MENDNETSGPGDKGPTVGHCLTSCVWRTWLAMLALSLWLIGCSGEDSSSEPSPSAETSSDSGAVASESNDVESADTSHDATNGSTDAHGDATSDAVTDVTPAISPETQRARELFASLLNPQSAEDWDQVQTELKELGTAAIPVIIESLASSNRIEREMAAQHLVLLELDFSDETEHLLAALEDESEQVRTYSAAVLLTQSPAAAEQAVATLIDVLRGTDAAMSEMAASYLQTFPESVVGQLPQVIVALRDAPPKVAVPLIEAIAAAGPQAADANEVLTDLADSSDADVADAARQALDAISGPSE